MSNYFDNLLLIFSSDPTEDVKPLKPPSPDSDNFDKQVALVIKRLKSNGEEELCCIDFKTLLAASTYIPNASPERLMEAAGKNSQLIVLADGNNDSNNSQVCDQQQQPVEQQQQSVQQQSEQQQSEQQR